MLLRTYLILIPILSQIILLHLSCHTTWHAPSSACTCTLVQPDRVVPCPALSISTQETFGILRSTCCETLVPKTSVCDDIELAPIPRSRMGRPLNFEQTRVMSTARRAGIAHGMYKNSVNVNVNVQIIWQTSRCAKEDVMRV
jgi:hypothetical protein